MGKEYRKDNTYILTAGTGENPKLGVRLCDDGRDSLFLDYYFGFTWEVSKAGEKYKKADRKREYLKLYLVHTPRTAEERQQNKNTLELAKRIRYERGQQLLESQEGYRIRIKNKNINFLEYYKAYISNYTKKDKRVIISSYNQFITFLSESSDYQKYAREIKPEQLTPDLVRAFTEFLQSRCRGEGAHTAYARFKKVVKYAVEHDVILKDPTKGISIRIDTNVLKKDILSQEEIKTLINTHYAGENINIRRAFIFSLYCGLRWCDVKDLTFSNVDYSNRLLKFEQNKTKGHSGASGVMIPLNEGLLRLIGTGEKQELIFPLPSQQMCLKALKHWVKKAEIDKHITWHCARHSFAVNILNNGANIKTVASLLGHSGLVHTEKYTRAVDALKQAAIDSLPELDI